MKLTKTRIKQIIKEELAAGLAEYGDEIKEAGRPHSMRGGRTMADLDKDAKTRETDFLKNKKKKKVFDLPEDPEPGFYADNPGVYKEDLEEKKDEKWIQGAEKDIEKRGTEGVCTGDKFGGPTCKPGTKRYNLAKTFRKMAKDKKK